MFIILWNKPKFTFVSPYPPGKDIVFEYLLVSYKKRLEVLSASHWCSTNLQNLLPHHFHVKYLETMVSCEHDILPHQKIIGIVIVVASLVMVAWYQNNISLFIMCSICNDVYVVNTHNTKIHNKPTIPRCISKGKVLR